MNESRPLQDSTGLPLISSLARRIIEELFQTKGLWKRGDLAAEVERIHFQRGGIKGTQDALPVVKKALRDLLEDGKVEKASYGQWRWAGEGSEYLLSKPNDENPLSNNSDEAPDNQTEDITPKKQIGEGPESVYLYYNPNDRKLAEYEGRNAWECKIGRTGIADTLGRIIGQGAKTALSHPPVVGLVIKTQDSAALERALHASLRILEKEVEDSLGTEWFMTSPEHVEVWYKSFQIALAQLKGPEAPYG